MKVIRNLIFDIRYRQNLDIYIAVLLAFVISGLGFFQITDLNIIASAILAILALVSVNLLVNRRENELIIKELTKIELLSNRFDEIIKGLDVKVSFVAEDPAQPETGRAKIRDIISQASQEILILDYNSTRALERKDNKERKIYYDELLKRVIDNKAGAFRYRRILQIPESATISDFLSKDTVLLHHCIDLVKLGESRPEKASLKSCSLLYQGTCVLVDKRYLIIEIPIFDPESNYHTDGGQFIFDDFSGGIICHFLQFFDRADANSILVKSKDLQNLNRHQRLE